MEQQNTKHRETRSMPFEIDLNETPPLPSPRDSDATSTGKGKLVLLDINALPTEASAAAAAATGDESAYQFPRMHAVRDFSSTTMTCSNLLERNYFEEERRDYSGPTVEFQNLSEKLLEALREFIYDNRGVLEDGWRVEFVYSENRCKTFAVYCAPDGNRFESMFDVACHLGLVNNSHSLVQKNGLHLHKRRKESFNFSRIKDDLKESQEELSLGIDTVNADNLKVANPNSGEAYGYGASHCKDRFPVQFEDFFILSVGEVDPRPSYHSTSQIWPVGYKSSWHDKITGSLFVCHVSDGGDLGPVFRVRRYPCSTEPIPIGSTILSRPNPGIVNNKTDTAFDMEDNEDFDVQMLFSDDSPPHLDFNILSGVGIMLDEVSHSQPMRGLQTHHNRNSPNLGKLEQGNRRPADDIGEFLVEGRSSSSVWTMVSQNLARACQEAYEQTGACKFHCRHGTYGWWSSCIVLEDVVSIESTNQLAKFCQMSGPLNVPCHIQSNDELSTSCEALVKWLDQDRFGLDVEFVQEIIEQLPGVHACSGYKFLNERSDKSKLQTVGSGFLLAKRKNGVQDEKEADNTATVCKKPRRQVVEKPILKDSCPPYKPLSSKLPTYLIGDVLQSWELLWRFSEVLGLEEPVSFKELEEELTDCCSFALRSAASTVIGKSQHALIMEETESLKEGTNVRQVPDNYGICTGETLTKAHCSLLKVLLAELQSKLLAFVDPAFEIGESKSRKRRKREADNLTFAKKTMLDLLPINELTWPELARRYVLTVSSMGGNLDSVESVSRESCRVFHCLQGDSGALSGSLPGVAAMEADALLLAEATKQIFGSSMSLNDLSNVDCNDTDAPSAPKTVNSNDGEIPDWAQVLEPVRKLPTNVGARIRKCIYEALDKNPPEWAKKILEHSISKEVYKGNASGPTKRAVLSLLADVHGENWQQKPNRKKKNKYSSSSSDVIMKQCRKVLRQSAAADEEKVFCNLLGRTVLHTSDNDDEGLLGFPSMVSRPLDFRTIDLRLAFGAYGGSHEAFLEDVREVWHHIRTAYADQSDLVHLAENLSQKFEELYEKEVLTLVRKLVDYATVECLSPETKKEVEDILEHAPEIPKAPWDEGVCRICGIDKDDVNVLLCDKCDSGYHTYCLNPPLARVPEGNWYCPSCATGHHVSPAAMQDPWFISQCRKKRRRGEFTQGFLEALTNLATTMEVKDYWEYSTEERIFLLKFLGDEVLNSANIREHLDQCASTATDLQQKLRLRSTEWRNMKFRDEILTEKLSEVNTNVFNGVGMLGTAGNGMAAVTPDHDKQMGQIRTRLCLSPSNDWMHSEDSLQWHSKNDFTKQSCWFHSKGVSEKHYINNGSQFMKTSDSECQVNQPSGKDNRLVFENSSSCILPFSAKDEYTCQNKSLSIPQHQTYENGDFASWKNFEKEMEFNKGSGLILPTCEAQHGHVSSDTSRIQMAEHACATRVISENPLPILHGVIQPDVNEIQSYNLEASNIKNKMSVLQDSIACLESQLQKVSPRKDFLGRDFSGRLYWAFCRPGSSPWVVVDGTMAVQQRSIIREHRDMSDNLTFNSNAIGKETLSEFNGSNILSLRPSARTDGIPIPPPWFSYQTHAEVEELIRWLKENDPKERELLESLLQLKFGCKDSNKAVNHVCDVRQAISSPINSNRSFNYSTLQTKALIALEKLHGPCLELDALTPVNINENTEVVFKERMCRCECLEPIWPSRNHCRLCHWSFSTRCELMEHNDGKCSSGACATQKSKVKTDVPKGKLVMSSDRWECSGKTRTGKSGSRGHEIDFKLVGFSKDFSSPYDIEEISEKFITRNSNKELVKEIGLLGSNGTPSFLPCTSPYLSDPTLNLSSSWNNEVDLSNKSMSMETQLQQPLQGNVISSKRNCSNSFDATNSCTGHDILKSNLKDEKRDQSSLKFSCSKVGNASFSVIHQSSQRPLIGRGTQILRQLKINLLDMDAALPSEAMKPSKACSEKRCAWRAFVKSAKSVFEMVQGTIVFENMIKTEYLRNEWWYWSSLSAAAKIAAVSSLALRIYTLDAAIIYDKDVLCSPKENSEVGTKPDNNSSSHMDPASNSKPSCKSVQRTQTLNPTENGKSQSKSGKKRKDSGG